MPNKLDEILDQVKEIQYVIDALPAEENSSVTELNQALDTIYVKTRNAEKLIVSLANALGMELARYRHD